MWRMTLFTLFFSLFWLQILNLPASLQNKTTRIGPFPWKRSVLQNPDRERTNQSTGICLRLGLPYNNQNYCVTGLQHPRFSCEMLDAQQLKDCSEINNLKEEGNEILVFQTIWQSLKRLRERPLVVQLWPKKNIIYSNFRWQHYFLTLKWERVERSPWILANLFSFSDKCSCRHTRKNCLIVGTKKIQ